MTKRYGNWEISESIGEGGQGHVFLAKDLLDTRQGSFALKRLKNKKRMERFRKEIESCKSLSEEDKGFLRWIDSDLEGKSPYLVTEYCPNGSLSDDDNFQKSLIEKLQIFQEICRTVGIAHSKGIVHRDLKPENIFFREDGSVAVGDFGLCFIEDDGERVTFTEEVVGSRHYAAPEIEDGRAEDITASCDVYSLGKVLYFMIAGRIFSREKHRVKPFDLATGSADPNIHMIYEILDKTITANPATRFESAGELDKEVLKLIDRISKNARPVNPNIPLLCQFCGIGFYRPVVAKRSDRDSRHGTDIHNFGFSAVGNPDWTILVCNHCGHVQFFRADLSNNKHIWRKETE